MSPAPIQTPKTRPSPKTPKQARKPCAMRVSARLAYFYCFLSGARERPPALRAPAGQVEPANPGLAVQLAGGDQLAQQWRHPGRGDRRVAGVERLHEKSPAVELNLREQSRARLFHVGRRLCARDADIEKRERHRPTVAEGRFPCDSSARYERPRKTCRGADQAAPGLRAPRSAGQGDLRRA